PYAAGPSPAAYGTFTSGGFSGGHVDDDRDRNPRREVVEHGAVGLDGLPELDVAFRALGAAQRHPRLDTLEAGTHVGVDAEEAADVDVPCELDLHTVETDPELLRPHLVSDDVARAQRREQVVDGVGAEVGAAERGGLVDGEPVAARIDRHLRRRA